MENNQSPPPASADPFSGLLKEIPEMIFEYFSRNDNRMLFTYASPESAEILGYRPRQLRTAGPGVFSLIHKADRRDFYRKASQSASSCTRLTWQGRFYNRLKGEYRLLKLTSKPTKQASGLVKWCGVISDVTSVMELEQRLAEAREKALQETQAKEDFLATVSHEIRTPLNGIVGVTNLMLDEADGSQMEYLRLLKAASNNLVALVNNILDFSKLNSGEMVVAENKMSLQGIADNLRQIHSFKATENRNTLKLELDEQLPEVVVGDEMILTQILNNLLSNANKFTRDGEVRLGVQLNGQNDKVLGVRFYVSDTGIGIQKKDLPHIFTRFRQARNTVNHQGGTGLGLPICRELTQLLHSDLEVESTPGKGTQFSFCLDFKKPNSNGAYRKKQAKPAAGFQDTQADVVAKGEKPTAVMYKPWSSASRPGAGL